jgi:hypothetical protein
MAKVAPFYSVNEIKKPPDKRVYHDDSACPSGRDIPPHDRRSGTGGLRHCNDCDR